MAEERVMVHTKGRVKHGPTANIDEDYFFFTKGLAVGVVKILEPMNPILNYYECGIVNGGQSGAIGIGVCMPLRERYTITLPQIHTCTLL